LACRFLSFLRSASLFQQCAHWHTPGRGRIHALETMRGNAILPESAGGVLRSSHCWPPRRLQDKHAGVQYFWPGLFQEKARYVRRCSSSQKFKENQDKPAGKMFMRYVDESFHELCDDFVGPLPHSKLGNSVLLVFLLASG